MSSIAIASAPALRSSWMRSLTAIGSKEPSAMMLIPCPSTPTRPPNAVIPRSASSLISMSDWPSTEARS